MPEMTERLLASTWTPKVPVCWMFFHPIYPRLKLATCPFMLITPFWFPTGRWNQNMLRAVSSFQEVCLPCFLLVFQSRSRVSGKCWYIGWTESTIAIMESEKGCRSPSYRRIIMLLSLLSPLTLLSAELIHSVTYRIWSPPDLMASMLFSSYTAVPQPHPHPDSTPNC